MQMLYWRVYYTPGYPFKIYRGEIGVADTRMNTPCILYVDPKPVINDMEDDIIALKMRIQKIVEPFGLDAYSQWKEISDLEAQALIERESQKGLMNYEGLDPNA